MMFSHVKFTYCLAHLIVSIASYSSSTLSLVERREQCLSHLDLSMGGAVLIQTQA